MGDTFISKNSTRERIDPATEDKQRDVETRLEEIKLLNSDLVNVLTNIFAAKSIEGETHRLANATSDVDTTVEVIPGGTYVFTSLAYQNEALPSVIGGFYFGLADTQVVVNVQWVCGLNQTILIKIPVGKTTLHYATASTLGVGYLRRIG